MTQLEAFPDEVEPAISEGVPVNSAGAQSESDFSDLSSVRAHSSATDWTVETIVTQMRKGRLDLDPKFQRRAAWTDATKSRFIESAILAYPIPQLVLAEIPDRSGHFLVIDGKQRLLALRQFYADADNPADSDFDPLKLTGLTILDELKGSSLQGLADSRPDLFDQFENNTIRTVVVRTGRVILFCTRCSCGSTRGRCRCLLRNCGRHSCRDRSWTTWTKRPGTVRA